MKFGICIKQVPDVTASIHTGRMVLNAYDASAVEEALVLKAAYGGTLDLVLIGPDSAKETIRKALAMGADSATHIVTAPDANIDSAGFSRILADHFQGSDHDVILCGKQAQDTDAGLTGSMLAQRLGLPYTTNAVGLAIEAGTLIVTRQGDAGQELIALPTPCLVTCSNDMNDPRIPTLRGIMQAKRKKIQTVPLSDVGTVATHVKHLEDLPAREPGQMLSGDLDEMIAQLTRELSETANVL